MLGCRCTFPACCPPLRRNARARAPSTDRCVLEKPCVSIPLSLSLFSSSFLLWFEKEALCTFDQQKGPEHLHISKMSLLSVEDVSLGDTWRTEPTELRKLNRAHKRARFMSYPVNWRPRSSREISLRRRTRDSTRAVPPVRVNFRLALVLAVSFAITMIASARTWFARRLMRVVAGVNG